MQSRPCPHTSSHLLNHAPAGHVLDRDVSADAVEVDLLEAEGDKAGGHLGGLAAAPVLGRDAEAEAAIFGCARDRETVPMSAPRIFSCAT